MIVANTIAMAGRGRTPPPSSAALGVWRRLGPTRFVAAIALGLADSVLLALVYTDARIPQGIRLSETAALLGLMAGTVLADRAGHRKTAWALLASTYALMLLMAAHQMWSVPQFLIGQIMGHCLVFAIAIADEAMARGAAGRKTYWAAAIAGIALGALIWALVLHVEPDLFAGSLWLARRASPWFGVTHPIYTASHWMIFGGAAVLFYAERRLALAALARLRAAELERILRSREVVETRLQAMQAHVEPQFLFATLAHVRRLYGRDAALAECMLQELVAFLRAAMPRMRDTSSTFGAEAELARAYLSVMRIRLGERLDFSIDIPPIAAAARLPPMMLLPLVGHVASRRSGDPREHGGIRIEGRVIKDRLQVALTDTGGAFNADCDGAQVAAVRERLAALYGGQATLTLARGGVGGTRAVMEVPYEPVP